MKAFIRRLIVAGALTALAFALPLKGEAGPYTSKSQLPGAEPTVAGTETEKPAKKHHAKRGGKGKHHRMAMMKNLSPEERERFKGIYAKLKDYPDVQEARKAVRNAESKGARRAARKNLYEVSRSHLSADDQAFLDQLKAKHPKAGKSGRCKSCGKNG
jgi:hypothetical protein